MAQTMDFDQYAELRSQAAAKLSEFEELIELRESAKAEAQKARNALQVNTQFTTMVNGFDWPDNTDVPTGLPEDTVEWLKDQANKSVQEVADELAILHTELKGFQSLAASIGLKGDALLAIDNGLKKYNVSNAVMTVVSAGSGALGTSKTDRVRALAHVPVIEHYDPNGVRQPDITPGGRNGVGDWISGRYEIKKRVDKTAAENGLSPEGEWSQFKTQLNGIVDEFLAVDAGDQPSLEREVRDSSNNVFRITY